MQVFGLPRQMTRTAQSASRLLGAKPANSDAQRRRDAVARWVRARADGLTADQAARAVGVGRATLYRWVVRAQAQSRRPHQVRKPHGTPALAKAVKICGPTIRCGASASSRRCCGARASSCRPPRSGGSLRKLMDRGVVIPVPTLRRNPAARRVRLTARERYDRRLPKGHKPSRPGELVQIDTLFVTVQPGNDVKPFTAYDPVARWTVGRVASAATALAATALLDKLCKEAPFPVTGIQVDGGSEFMADFEEACEARGLTLFVLPPKRPQLNGAVERTQGSWRYEFYGCFDLPHRITTLQQHVDAFAHRYNHHRPHQALADQTPAEYLASISSGPPASHRS